MFIAKKNRKTNEDNDKNFNLKKNIYENNLYIKRNKQYYYLKSQGINYKLNEENNIIKMRNKENCIIKN